MKNLSLYFILLMFFSVSIQAQNHSQHTSISSAHSGHEPHDPLLLFINMEDFQSSLTQDQPVYQGKLTSWIGKDKNKLGIRARIENTEGASEYIEKELFFASALNVFWDWQFGWRQDRNPASKMNWLTLSAEGEAPYFIHSQIQLLTNQDGDAGLRLHFQQDWRINNSWNLRPETEINFYSKDHSEFSHQAGLSDAHLSVKLLYDNIRKLAPYIALEYEKNWAGTTEVDTKDAAQISAGMSFWF